MRALFNENESISTSEWDRMPAEESCHRITFPNLVPKWQEFVVQHMWKALS